MIPIIYIGIFSFFSSFTISHSVTREYLRYTFDIKIEESKKDSKVKFNNEVKFKIITPISNISSNTLDRLWYKKEDYHKFKKEFLKLKRYNSI
jgi:hypothetical protein